jgi:hypothetical protein
MNASILSAPGASAAVSVATQRSGFAQTDDGGVSAGGGWPKIGPDAE